MIVKAVNFLILAVGIALIIVGAVAGSITIAIIGDMLAIGGILLFWVVKEGMLPSALGGSAGSRAAATSDAAGEDNDSRRDAGSWKGPDGA